MMHYGWNEGGWGIFWMLTSMVAMVAIVWAIVVVLVRSSTGDHVRGRDPTDVLAERFAMGGIDEDEYRKRLHLLEEAAKRTARGGS
jgi:putative membrane protein